MKQAKATAIAARPAGDTEPPLRAVEDDLAAAEAKLLSLLNSNEQLISEICRYLIDGSGKRLRPLFILLVYRACGGRDERLPDAIDAAIALELIHNATLLHDDIVDGGTLRRGKPSALARHGIGPTLIAGDYLFCKAFELCGRFEEHLVHIAARACIQLSEGEVMEERLRYNPAAGLGDYLGVITRKTASLFAAGGRVAADLAGAPAATIESMTKLGNAVGLAFQMIDDLLDILGPEEKIGKPVGSDLRAGIPSLPVVLAMGQSAELRELLRSGAQIEGERLRRALGILRAPEIVATVRGLAARQVEVAREMLEVLAPSAHRDNLAAFIDEQVDREA